MNIKHISWTVFVLTSIACLIAFTVLPSDLSIPMHWGIDGQPDRYGSLLEAMLFPPAIMLFILLLFHFLPFLEPRKENLQESNKAKDWIAFCVVMLMAIIGVANISYANGVELPMMRMIMTGVMIMLLVLGNFIAKTRSNFFIGIRTPWTLSNEQVWRKTHRLAGRLFMLAGAIGLPLSFFLNNADLTKLVLILVLPAALIPVVYSWVVWRKLEKTES